MVTITIPDIQFAGFYYPEILRDLLLYLRRNKDKLGLTDENEYELHIQMMRAFALVGHLNNCRADLIAQEMMIDTLKLLESLKRLLKLIGVQLNSASPAKVDLLAKLSEVFSADQVGFIPELAEFTTESVPPIPYEVIESGGFDLDRTDRLSHIFALEKVKEGVGQVSITAPDIFTRTSGDTFSSTDRDKHLFVAEGLGGNGGEFRVTEYIDANNVRVVKVPGSDLPGFQTEIDLAWELKEFTADFAVENYTPGLTFTPWTDPVSGDCLYCGHSQVMVSQFDVDISSAAGSMNGCWEYFDGLLSYFSPNSITDNGDGTLTVVVNSLLGTPDRHGADILVEYIPTGYTERLVSVYAGSQNRIITRSLLGQISASTTAEDYRISSVWVPFDNQDDGSLNFTQDGAITFNFPQNSERSWNATEVNLVEGIWSRYRLIDVTSAPYPVIEEIKMDQGDQYMMFDATQGTTVGPQVIGGSTGGTRQAFSLPETPFLDESETIEVDETGAGGWVTWVATPNFLNSIATSRHYILTTDAQDKATIEFGDGVNGKIPPAGINNIRATYRVGGDTDGNVGIGEVTSNADGVNGISEVTNPRAAYGWRMKDGGTEEDIERIKRDAPAGLRTRNTASTAADVELLAINKFIDSDQVRPVARATADEEGFGPKTIKLMVVGNGGIPITSSQKTELEDYFNGNRYASPPSTGVLVTNHRVYVVNFEPKIITIEASVAWTGGNAESIRNALLALLNPLALEPDGYTYAWDFGGWISRSRIFSEIHAVDPGITDVPSLLINGSATSLHLGSNQLPVSIASYITIHLQDSV